MQGLGWIFIAVGLFGCAFLVLWTNGFVGGLVKIFGPWGYLSLLAAMPGFLPCGAAIALGMTAMYGHAETAIVDGMIRYSECLGPLSWTRRIYLANVARLAVHGVEDVTTSRNSKPAGRLSGLAALKAELLSGKPRWLIIGYPRPWLLAVAEHMAHEVADDSFSVDAESLPVVAVVDVPTSAAGEFERQELADDSLIVQQEVPGGFTLAMPARGVWKGSAGLFAFSLIWCGFMAIFTTALLGVVLFGEMPEEENAWWIVPLVVTLFWSIGIGMLVAAINMGRREAALAVVNGQLKLIESSLFGVTRREWELAEILTVRKGPSGMEVNDVPVMQLQIVLHDGKTCGLFTGRDDAEIEWIATQLRAALPLPDEPLA